jgi:hypothetical protein
MVLPHSHLGPIFDPLVDGVFCGAMDPARGEVGCGTTEPPLAAPAKHRGSIHVAASGSPVLASR